MTALAIALAGLLALSMSLNVALFVAQRGDSKEARHMRDLVDQQQSLAAQYKSRGDIAVVAHKVAEEQLDQERNLRVIAESQRNAAQERVRDLLRKHVANATNEEIQELTNEVFTTPLSLAPRPVGRVPQVPRSEDPRDGLLDPFAADLQPPKPA